MLVQSRGLTRDWGLEDVMGLLSGLQPSSLWDREDSVSPGYRVTLYREQREEIRAPYGVCGGHRSGSRSCVLSSGSALVGESWPVWAFVFYTKSGLRLTCAL